MSNYRVCAITAILPNKFLSILSMTSFPLTATVFLFILDIQIQSWDAAEKSI